MKMMKKEQNGFALPILDGVIMNVHPIFVFLH